MTIMAENSRTMQITDSISNLSISWKTIYIVIIVL